jgi:membrane protease YdiL (CAAX protease family)
VNSFANPTASDRDPRATWLRPELIAAWPEIAVVVTVIIGLSTLTSSWQAWHGSSQNYIAMLLTDRRMVHTILIESSILGLLLVLLHWRGWKMSDFKIKPTWPGTGVGLLLIPGMMLANSITVATGFVIFYFLQPQGTTFTSFIMASAPKMAAHSIHVSWLAVIPALIFNGFFEEMTCMGYAFNQFAAKRGPVFALILTVLLRMSCHTYQGVIHALGIGAAFFLFGLVYLWTRNLWPLILAHIIVDSLSFGALKLLFG